MTIDQNTEGTNIPFDFVVEHYDNDQLAEANEQLALTAVRLESENAKLRELVFKYAEIANYFCEREDYCSCDFVAQCAYYKPQQCRLGELNDKLRELGIEVDG